MNVVGLSCPGHHGFGIVLLPNKTLLVTGLSTGLAREPRMRVPLLPQCFHNNHRAPALQVNWRLWTLNHNRHHADNSVHHPDVVSMTVMSATHIKIGKTKVERNVYPSGLTTGTPHPQKQGLSLKIVKSFIIFASCLY